MRFWIVSGHEKATGVWKNRAAHLPCPDVCAHMPILLILTGYVFRDIFLELDFRSKHRTSLGRGLQEHQVLRMENAHSRPRG